MDAHIVSVKTPSERYKKLSGEIVLPVAVAAILLYFTKGFYGQAGGIVFDKTVLYISVALGSFLFISEIYSFPCPKIARKYTVIMLMGWGFVLYNNSISQGFAFFPIVFSSIGVALWIYRTSTIHKRIHLILSIILIGFVGIFVLILFALDLNIVNYTNASRNHVSMAMLGLSAYYCIVRRKNSISISIFLPIWVLLISFISVGTGGIISSLIFATGFFFRKNKQTVLFLILAWIAIANFNQVVDISYKVDKNC